MPLTEKSQTTESASQSAPDSSSINLLHVIQVLRSVGGPLVTQVALYGQLARVDWEAEKRRLLKMFVAGLLGFVCLLSILLIVSAVLLVISWQTTYRIPVAISLVIIYGIGVGFAWFRLQSLSAQSDQAFAATREEIAEDIALLKGKI